MNIDVMFRQVLHSPWLPRAVSFLLIVLIGWWAVYVIYPLFEIDETRLLKLTPVVKSSVSKPVRPLKDLNLFGESITTNKDVVKAVDTKLNLTLRGIYYQKSGDASMAIIQNNDTKIEEHYVIGDKVFQLAILDQIHIDRVILLHNGRYETLRLPRKSLNLESIPDPAVVASKTIQEFRNDLATGNMEKYIFHVDYDTVFDDDGFLGFEIIADSDKGREILRKIGLAQGDVVTEIDGIILSENPDLMKAIKSLRTAKKATIGINRGGTTIYLNLDFTK